VSFLPNEQFSEILQFVSPDEKKRSAISSQRSAKDKKDC
jgi:hypothetical protein